MAIIEVNNLVKTYKTIEKEDIQSRRIHHGCANILMNVKYA